ncbi:MAG: hypothetical protein ACO1NU_04190 [Arcticibacter sp.]
MRKLKGIISGLAGAIAVNILHETVRKYDSKAPRVDLIGKEALSKGLSRIGVEPPKGKKLHQATLAGDIVSNALYYSLIASGNQDKKWLRGTILGASAGLGALKLPKPMGLDDTPVTKNQKAEALTVLYYTFGGLVTAAVYALLNRK